jgi:hypothetical protein
VKVALSEIAAALDARALARLGLCLDHPSWEVRRLAAELLGQDASPGAQALLRARYEREKDPIVREAIEMALSVRPPPNDASKAPSFRLPPLSGAGRPERSEGSGAGPGAKKGA